MEQRLSRRRWAEVTRYLKSVVSNPKAKESVRMAAATRLCEIYGRHEDALTRKELAEMRAEARKAQGSASGPQEPAHQSAEDDAEEAEEARIEAVFANILNKPKAPNAIG